jgi:hypothetical protein
MNQDILPPETSIRPDGWTLERQCQFLEALAADGAVSFACDEVGLSPQSAYRFRNRREGIAFKLGWDAAILIARARLRDELMERAIRGQTDKMMRDRDADEIKRYRQDNRLAMGMLTRMDRIIVGMDLCESDAVIVAQDWDAYLDLIARGLNGAASGLFLASRRPSAVENDAESADFGDDRRCKLLPEEEEEEPPYDPRAEVDPQELLAEMSVWRDPQNGAWRTNFPPPDDFDENDQEMGVFGDPDYERVLSNAEWEAMEARNAARLAPVRKAGLVARAAFFGLPVRSKRKRKHIEIKSMEPEALPLYESELPSVLPELAAEALSLDQPGSHAEPQPDSETENPDEFINGVRIYVPGTREFTEEYQKLRGFRTIKMPPRLYYPYGTIPPWATKVW